MAVSSHIMGIFGIYTQVATLLPLCYCCLYTLAKYMCVFFSVSPRQRRTLVKEAEDPCSRPLSPLGFLNLCLYHFPA